MEGSTMLPTSLPFLLITRMEPAWAVAQLPERSGDGKFPTSTKPACRMFRAVVSPRGAVPWKNTDAGPVAWILTIVVPVPCAFVLLLKLDTRISPGLTVLPVG